MSHEQIHCKCHCSPFRWVCYLVCIMVSIGVGSLFVWRSMHTGPVIKLDSMDFTVLNITETRLSANWDLNIRIPSGLPGKYICLQGDVQASLLYKNVTLATSSPQKYNNLQYGSPQLLKVSALVSNEDISGSIGEDIIEDIQEKKEVQFASLFSFPDCTKNTTGVMSFACHEVTLKFEPESEMKATVFGNHLKCKHVHLTDSTSSSVH